MYASIAIMIRPNHHMQLQSHIELASTLHYNYTIVTLSKLYLYIGILNPWGYVIHDIKNLQKSHNHSLVATILAIALHVTGANTPNTKDGWLDHTTVASYTHD